MNSFLKNIDAELSKKIVSFEKNNGELQKFVVYEFLTSFGLDMSDFNSFFNVMHKMTMIESFCEPDLNNLINYEEELNGRY